MKRFYLKSTFWLSLLYLATLFVLDISTKIWVFQHVPLSGWSDTTYPYGGIGIFQHMLGGVDFSLNYVRNTGSAWGLFSNYMWPLFIIRSLMVAALIVYRLFFTRHKQYGFPLIMIIGGALCNLLDVALYGHVIDMIHFNLWGYHYPVFNIADISIVIGVLLLALFSMLESIREKRPRHES